MFRTGAKLLTSPAGLKYAVSVDKIKFGEEGSGTGNFIGLNIDKLFRCTPFGMVLPGLQEMGSSN